MEENTKALATMEGPWWARRLNIADFVERRSKVGITLPWISTTPQTTPGYEEPVSWGLNDTNSVAAMVAIITVEPGGGLEPVMVLYSPGSLVIIM